MSRPLSLAEDLALLLDSREVADALLAKLPLRQLYYLPLRELERLMPRRCARRFHAMLRIAEAVANPERPRQLENSGDIARYVYSYLAHQETERMLAVACDGRCRPLAIDVVAIGTPVSVSARLADLFAVAVRHRAPALFIAHNHPSGDPTPSDADRVFTERAIAGGLLLGIDVLDHVIVAGNLHASLREQGGVFDVARAIVLP